MFTKIKFNINNISSLFKKSTNDTVTNETNMTHIKSVEKDTSLDNDSENKNYKQPIDNDIV
jgi:hypothetical protein